MKGVFYIILLLFAGMFISCSTSKNVQNGAVKSDDHMLKTVSYANHSGRYEHCSICQRVRMNQESAIAQLNTELPEVKVEEYESLLLLHKESFRVETHVLAKDKIVPNKIYRIPR
jgi:hypothetical protein